MTPAPPRIVFNGRFLLQGATGVQRYAQETLLALDALLSGSQAPPEWAGTSFEVALPQGARALPRRLNRIAPVVLAAFSRHGHLWEQTTLALHARGAFLVGFSYSGPVLHRKQLITVHDAAVRAFSDTYSRSYRWLHDLLLSVLSPRVQRVMTVSEFSRQELVRWYGLKASRLSVGHEGAEHAVSLAPASRVRERFGLEPGSYLLCVGSLKRSKGLEQVAQALQRLPLSGEPGLQDLTLAIAGAADPRLFPTGDAQSALPADPRVKRLGFVDDTDLFALYRHARGFVMPSLYEGFGLPAIEALANGCPVLAARAASLPEVLGDAVQWYPPGDVRALAQGLRDLWRLQREAPAEGEPAPLGEGQRAVLSRHGWDRAAVAVLGAVHRPTSRLP